MDFFYLLLIFATGFFARVLSNIAGGGAGLIEAPLLLMLGVPPKITVATRKFAALGGHAMSAYKFNKSKLMNWRVAIIISIISLIATIIGANLLVLLNDELIKHFIVIMMLVALPFTFFKKSFGLKSKITSKFSKGVGYIVNFFIFLIDSFVGVGGGLLSSLSMIIFMGLTYLQVSAIRRVVGLSVAITATIIFTIYGLIDWVVGSFLMLGGIIGSYVGSIIAIRKGNSFVKVAFTILVIVSVIRIMFF